ncbi:MAG: Hsp20/alpha crystallin family protein [Alphaproteobacteria bacterium]
MPPRNPGVWMWDEACEMLDRAERLNRQFFVPVSAHARRPGWEPPLDILETEDALWIVAALPGVSLDNLEVVVDSGVLIVRGERRLPDALRHAAIHRLEIPHGRFERRIVLPAGRYEAARPDLTDGCLVLRLLKMG